MINRTAWKYATKMLMVCQLKVARKSMQQFINNLIRALPEVRQDLYL